ncbi:FAD-binding oxidoreductase, partial [Rhizobiaceae sp. 2RAB30]
YVVPAGVVSHTGVAGLTLGGGMGWISRAYGLTIDSLIGAEIATASGAVQWVDADSDRELFWGLRGGGGNFGVVTRFRFKLHRLGPVAVGQWTYAVSDAKQAIMRLSEFARKGERKRTATLTLTSSGLTVTAIWVGDDRSAETMLSPFGQLAGTGQGTISRVSFIELQKRNDEHFAWSRRYYAKGGFWRDIGDHAVETMVEQIRDAPTADSEIYLMQLGGAVADVAEDATAYSGRQAGYYWIVEPVWDASSEDTRCIAWARATADRMADRTIDANYVNEQADTAIAASAYGAAKYQRLRRLKSRLDPTNLFRLNQNILPMDTEAR